MNALRIDKLSLDPSKNLDDPRRKAEEVADQFEELFVKTFISSMRQTASIGEQSMFGSGPGSDTYAGWFDANVANELGRSGGIGIARTLLEDMQRHGDIEADDAGEDKNKVNGELGKLADHATRAADAGAIQAATAIKGGGFDVVL